MTKLLRLRLRLKIKIHRLKSLKKEQKLHKSNDQTHSSLIDFSFYYLLAYFSYIYYNIGI